MHASEQKGSKKARSKPVWVNYNVQEVTQTQPKSFRIWKSNCSETNKKEHKLAGNVKDRN